MKGLQQKLGQQDKITQFAKWSENSNPRISTIGNSTKINKITIMSRI